MYYSEQNVFTSRSTTLTDLSKGSVVIKDKDILLNYDAYKKREKYPSLTSNYFSWKSGNSVYGLLKYAFDRMHCLISKPYYVETPNKIVIHLFYY